MSFPFDVFSGDNSDCVVDLRRSKIGEETRAAVLQELASEPTSSEPRHGVMGSFVRSAAYAGLQSPLTGASQLADRVVGTSLESQLQFIAPPAEEQFGSANWYSRQLGGAMGMLAPFMLAARGSRERFCLGAETVV